MTFLAFGTGLSKRQPYPSLMANDLCVRRLPFEYLFRFLVTNSITRVTETFFSHFLDAGDRRQSDRCVFYTIVSHSIADASEQGGMYLVFRLKMMMMPHIATMS